MRYHSSLVTYAFAIILLVAGGLQEKKLTNYEVVCAQVDTLAKSVVAALSAQDIKSLYLTPVSRDVDAFVRQRIVQELLKDNFQIMTDSSSIASLKVAVPLVGVSYSAPVASHIFGSSDVIRTIRSSYDLELADSGEVRFARSYSFVFSDTVREGQIPELESGTYGFLRGKSVSGGFLDTMLQPLLFIASAAVVVYLFFTLRGS